MVTDGSPIYRRPTCEEWDDDDADASNLLPPGSSSTRSATAANANVAAKRSSKPELVAHPAGVGVGSGSAASKSKSRSKDRDKDQRTADDRKAGKARGEKMSSRDKKMTAGLKINTSSGHGTGGAQTPLATGVPERSSRQYSSGPLQQQPQPQQPQSQSQSQSSRQGNSSRVKSRKGSFKTSAPEPSSATPFRHGPQEGCYHCNVYGTHYVGANPMLPAKENRVPHSATPTAKEFLKQQLMLPKGSEAQKKSSSRPVASRTTPRPLSYISGVPYEQYPTSADPASQGSWGMPTTPLVGSYPDPTAYAHTPTSAYPQYPGYSQPQDMPFPQRGLLEPAGHSYEAPKGSFGHHMDPVIEQGSYFDNQMPLTRKTSTKVHSSPRGGGGGSRSKEEDTMKMPPPKIIPIQRRDSTARPSLGSTDKRRDRGYTVYGSLTSQPASTKSRADPAPSSFRDAPSVAYPNPTPERPAPKKAASYAEPQSSYNSGRSLPKTDSKASGAYVDRREADVEAYQWARGTRPQELTLDAMRQMSRHSDDGSQRSVHSSSRGSSGGKTKSTAANGFTMTSNGLIVSVSGPEAESVRIERKPDGGFDIRPASPKDTKMILPIRSNSVSSWGKTSGRGGAKESARAQNDEDDWPAWDEGPSGSRSKALDWDASSNNDWGSSDQSWATKESSKPPKARPDNNDRDWNRNRDADLNQDWGQDRSRNTRTQNQNQNQQIWGDQPWGSNASQDSTWNERDSGRNNFSSKGRDRDQDRVRDRDQDRVRERNQDRFHDRDQDRARGRDQGSGRTKTSSRDQGAASIRPTKNKLSDGGFGLGSWSSSKNIKSEQTHDSGRAAQPSRDRKWDAPPEIDHRGGWKDSEPSWGGGGENSWDGGDAGGGDW